MTIEMAKFLMAASNDAGNDARLVKDYSGRGMYGKPTIGLVVESLPQLMTDVLRYIKSNMAEFNDERDDPTILTEWTGMEVPNIEDDLRWDNMGMQTIVY